MNNPDHSLSAIKVFLSTPLRFIHASPTLTNPPHQDRLAIQAQLEAATRQGYTSYWRARVEYAQQHLIANAFDDMCDVDVAAVLDANDLSTFKRLPVLCAMGIIVAALFAAQHIDVVVLQSLTDADLHTIGITSLGARLHHIASYCAALHHAGSYFPLYCATPVG